MKPKSELSGAKIFLFNSLWGLILCWNLLFLPFPFQKQVEGSEATTPVFTYKIVQVFPHDPEAFTQGLLFYKGFLYEGTGLLGKSTLRQVDLKTGKILKRVFLPDQYFGEGITLWDDKIIQLTWKSGAGLVYDRETFRLLKKFTYFSEGWGITQDGKHLIMSDGTSFLYFLDPISFKEVRRVQVSDRGMPVSGLNELEYIKPSSPARGLTPRGLKTGLLRDQRYIQTQGEIFANVYMTDRIVKISPKTGEVTGWIDLRGLLPAEDRDRPVDVLNGIAYDAGKDRILVTGKYWPHLFEIRLIRK